MPPIGRGSKPHEPQRIRAARQRGESGDGMRSLVIGVGSARGNDAVGLHVVERLRGRELPPDVEIRLRDRPDAALLDDLEGASVAVLVDALRSGATPGLVVRLPPTLFTRARMGSSGSLRVAEALSLAVALERRLPPLRVIGIEIDGYDGEGLSPAVAAAIEPACEAVLAALAELRPLA